MRVVVKQNFSYDLAEILVDDFEEALKFFKEVNELSRDVRWMM